MHARRSGCNMDFLLIGLIAALLFAAWNTDIKIDKLNGKLDDLTKIAKAVQGEVETIRKIVK
jgi:hypothetical protein